MAKYFVKTVEHCKYCDKEFLKLNKVHKYCSRKCYERGFRSPYRKKIRQEKAFKPVNRYCLTCHNQFLANRNKHAYCSIKCRQNSVKHVFDTCAIHAKCRQKDWQITQEQWERMSDCCCVYCYKPARNKVGTGSGLDRKDNDKGYTIDNVVPCCGRCNQIKGNKITYEEMILYIAPAIRAMEANRVIVNSKELNYYI